MFDVTVIGAGVTGSMLARELTKYKLSVCVLEKENDVSCGASKANSGIIHGGYDPVPGTLKAKLNAMGAEKLFSAAKSLNVPFKRNGSLVCAFSEKEDETVKALFERGKQNGINGLKILSGDEARKEEPALSEEVTSALLVENAGIICPYGLTIAAIGNAMDNGAVLKTNFKVSEIEKTENGFSVTNDNGETVETRFLVNCAGAFADSIAEVVDDKFFSIIPRAGQYMLLDKAEGSLVKHTVFQVPTADGKGILVTPTADGNLLIGPTADKVFSKDSTETSSEKLNEVERLAKKSVPAVNTRQVITSFCGVRASVESGDFIIEESKKAMGLLHIAGIDSPGLTSCVSIAEYAVEKLKGMGLEFIPNPDFNGEREDTRFFEKMTDEEKEDFVKAHPDYGRIVCRCEKISEGEIRDAIKRNPPANDMDGVKRRTRSGMGRCQGGFCGPYVMKIISEETGIPLCKVTKKGGNSFMTEKRL